MAVPSYAKHATLWRGLSPSGAPVVASLYGTRCQGSVSYHTWGVIP